MSKPWILIKKLLKLVEKSIDRFILTADLKFQVMVGNGLPVTVQGNETEELLVAVMLVPIVEMFGGPETTKEILLWIIINWKKVQIHYSNIFHTSDTSIHFVSQTTLKLHFAVSKKTITRNSENYHVFVNS